MAALPLLVTNDHLVICFLIVTASELIGVHESQLFCHKKKLLKLYIGVGGKARKCDQIEEHPEGQQNLICMHTNGTILTSGCSL